MKTTEQGIRRFVLPALLPFLFLIAGCMMADSGRLMALQNLPRVIAVEEWGGIRSDTSRGKHHRPVQITLHHGGVAFLRDKDPAQYLRNLQKWSRESRMWMDIPYHYLIDLDGNIYEGRDINIAGDTNTEYDPTGHALIMVLGNFEEVEPNAAQLNAVVATMAMLAAQFNIGVDKIAGHKDFSSQTACPGKSLIPLLKNGYFRQRVAAILHERE